MMARRDVIAAILALLVLIFFLALYTQKRFYDPPHREGVSRR
jgi:hypothetical protein